MSAAPRRRPRLLVPASAARRGTSRPDHWRSWSGATCARCSHTPEIDRARDGAGSRRALAAAGDAGAAGEPAPRPGEAGPANRAAHGSLPGRRRAAERVRAAPPGYRARLLGPRWPGARAHARRRSPSRNRSPRGSCRGVLPARAARAWSRRISTASGSCWNCWSTASSSPMATSRSVTSSLPDRRANATRFVDCEQTINTLFQRPNPCGRSRQGEPVRMRHSTASRNSRLSAPERPGSPALPGSNDATRSHCSSFRIKRFKTDLPFAVLNQISNAAGIPEVV